MNNKSILSTCCLLTALALTGCGKSEESTPAGAAAPKSADSALAGAADAAARTSESLKQAADKTSAEVQKAAASAKDQVQAAATAANEKAQELIAKAKDYVSKENWPEATSIMQQVASLKLSPEQQKLVDDIKAQIQKGVAKASASATKTVDNLLKK